MSNRQAERNLAKSRNRFFHEEKLPQQNFWLTWYDRVRPASPLSSDDRAALQGWAPVQSNCPELGGVVDDLIERMPLDWRPLAEELFVGRVFEGEVNATAHTSNQARIVRLPLQYTNVLHAYVTAWDEQVAGLKLLLGEVQAGGHDVERRVAALSHARFGRYWELLEEGGDDWRDPNQIAGLAADLRVVSAPDRSDLRADAVLRGERWIVCHEVAHHLLGHTVRSRKRLPAADVIAPFRNGNVISGLNSSQLQEHDADLLSHLLLAGAFRPDRSADPYDLYGAAIGGAMALVSLAHVNGHWATSDDGTATHPGFDVRWSLLHDVITRLSKGMLVGPAGDHPRDLLIDLSMFAAAAFDAARHRAALGADTRLTLLDLGSAALDRKAKLREEFALSNAAPGHLD